MVDIETLLQTRMSLDELSKKTGKSKSVVLYRINRFTETRNLELKRNEWLKNHSIQSMPIRLLDLPLRIKNGLENDGIHTVGELAKHKPDSLLKIPEIGERSLEKIFAALRNLNLILPR